MSQVTEQSVRLQTALASIKLIHASAVLDLTEDDFDFLTSNKVWIATDRSRARRCVFFFSSRRLHTICYRDWSSDVCSSDLFLFERHMASDATTHAFASEDRPFRRMLFLCFAQCFPMRSNQLRQAIGAFPAFAYVVVIESFDVSYLAQASSPISHPRMRRRRPCTGSEEKKNAHVDSRRTIAAISLLPACRSGFRRKICGQPPEGAECSHERLDNLGPFLRASRNRGNSGA